MQPTGQEVQGARGARGRAISTRRRVARCGVSEVRGAPEQCEMSVEVARSATKTTSPGSVPLKKATASVHSPAQAPCFPHGGTILWYTVGST